MDKTAILNNGPRPFYQSFSPLPQGGLYMKFEQNWLRGIRGDVENDNGRTHGRTDGRTTDKKWSL